MITEQDLPWWLEIAPTLEWIFAKTYADTAPHEYIVLERLAGPRWPAHDEVLAAVDPFQGA